MARALGAVGMALVLVDEDEGLLLSAFGADVGVVVAGLLLAYVVARSSGLSSN